MGNSSVIAGREDGGRVGLEGTMKGLHVNARFQPAGPQLYFAVKLDGLSIRGKQPVLSLRTLSIDSRVKLAELDARN